jgi:tyrosyl-tRNA synthetase
MSKSLNNYVGLREDALSMYSKLEKTPDSLLKDYFELLTNIDLETLPENPRECQKQLALEIVSQFHGRDAALEAKKTAESLVLGNNTGDTGEVIPEYSLAEVNFPVPLFYILNATGLCNSSGEGRRQMQGGAVRLDGDRLDDPNLKFNSAEELAGKVLRVGKKKFIRLVTS